MSSVLTYNGAAAVKQPLRLQTTGEEIANAVLHGIGALCAVSGLTLLVLKSLGFFHSAAQGALAVVSYTIFAASMLVMFLASTLYHALRHNGAKQVLRALDHSAIAVLIAGTYTPFCLTGLKGSLGWVFFGLEWGLAALGVVLYSVNYKPFKRIELFIYILMGWAIAAGWIPLSRAIPVISRTFLICGGAAYTLGIFWYVRRGKRFAHAVWHVFVLAGALCHWFAVWFLE